MITPSAAATLRTSQIIVALLVQGIFQPDTLESLQTLGGFLIVLSTITVIFDYDVEKVLSTHCTSCSSRNEDNRFNQIGRSQSSSWLDIPVQNVRIEHIPLEGAPTAQPLPTRRMRVVSISLS